MINGSNTNGAALLSLLSNLTSPDDNGVLFRSGSVGGMGGCGFEDHRVNIMFRDCGLVAGFATVRGIVLSVSVTNIGNVGGGRQTVRLLRGINLSRSRTGQEILGLSNKRRRHITVTHTLSRSPSVVLTSRPANGLSNSARSRVVKVFRDLARRNGYIVLIDRSPRMTSVYSMACRLGPRTGTGGGT